MRSTITFAVCLLAVCATVFSAVPTTISYQGRLTTPDGTPVPDGSYSIKFTIYEASSGGSTRWTETQSVTTSGGLFAIPLGAVSPISDLVFNETARYLGIKVGTDPELTPRVVLVSVPYAYRVGTLDGSTGGTISGNLNLENSTATSGLIQKEGTVFLHNSGVVNTFLGTGAGPTTLTGLYNTGVGTTVLVSLTSGADNTAVGSYALHNNDSGEKNTACGMYALSINETGSGNTALGWAADVEYTNLTNATAIGRGARVDASNKIRFGDNSVTVIEGQVAYTYTSDRDGKECFQPIDGDEVLAKIRRLNLTSWNYKNQDPLKFRHYGPVAQEFFEAFGHDGIGQCGDSTTINSGDLAGITLVAVQALQKQNELLQTEVAELKVLLQRLAAEKHPAKESKP